MSAKSRGGQKARPWVAMRRVPPNRQDTAAGADPDREVWANDKYIAHVERYPSGGVYSISFKRRDRKAGHDWRDNQRIKNDIAGAEVEAVELYPAMSRLMDTSNQYWLWCAPAGNRIEIGFEHGAVVDSDIEDVTGATQRPLPDDWTDPTVTPFIAAEDAARKMMGATE